MQMLREVEERMKQGIESILKNEKHQIDIGNSSVYNLFPFIRDLCVSLQTQNLENTKPSFHSL